MMMMMETQDVDYIPPSAKNAPPDISRDRDNPVGYLILNDREEPIYKEKTTIGRDVTSDIVVDAPQISRLHATIKANLSKGTAFICVYGKNNYLNSDELDPELFFRVADGDILDFRSIKFTYKKNVEPENDETEIVDGDVNGEAADGENLDGEAPKDKDDEETEVLDQDKSIVDENQVDEEECTQFEDESSPAKAESANESPVVDKSPGTQSPAASNPFLDDSDITPVRSGGGGFRLRRLPSFETQEQEISELETQPVDMPMKPPPEFKAPIRISGGKSTLDDSKPEDQTKLTDDSQLSTLGLCVSLENDTDAVVETNILEDSDVVELPCSLSRARRALMIENDSDSLQIIDLVGVPSVGEVKVKTEDKGRPAELVAEEATQISPLVRRRAPRMLSPAEIEEVQRENMTMQSSSTPQSVGKKSSNERSSVSPEKKDEINESTVLEESSDGIVEGSDDEEFLPRQLLVKDTQDRSSDESKLDASTGVIEESQGDDTNVIEESQGDDTEVIAETQQDDSNLVEESQEDAWEDSVENITAVEVVPKMQIADKEKEESETEGAIVSDEPETGSISKEDKEMGLAVSADSADLEPSTDEQFFDSMCVTPKKTPKKKKRMSFSLGRASSSKKTKKAENVIDEAEEEQKLQEVAKKPDEALSVAEETDVTETLSKEVDETEKVAEKSVAPAITESECQVDKQDVAEEQEKDEEAKQPEAPADSIGTKDKAEERKEVASPARGRRTKKATSPVKARKEILPKKSSKTDREKSPGLDISVEIPEDLPQVQETKRPEAHVGTDKLDGSNEEGKEVAIPARGRRTKKAASPSKARTESVAEKSAKTDGEKSLNQDIDVPKVQERKQSEVDTDKLHGSIQEIKEVPSSTRGRRAKKTVSKDCPEPAAKTTREISPGLDISIAEDVKMSPRAAKVVAEEKLDVMSTPRSTRKKAELKISPKVAETAPSVSKRTTRRILQQPKLSESEVDSPAKPQSLPRGRGRRVPQKVDLFLEMKSSSATEESEGELVIDEGRKGHGRQKKAAAADKERLESAKESKAESSTSKPEEGKVVVGSTKKVPPTRRGRKRPGKATVESDVEQSSGVEEPPVKSPKKFVTEKTSVAPADANITPGARSKRRTTLVKRLIETSETESKDETKQQKKRPVEEAQVEEQESPKKKAKEVPELRTRSGRVSRRKKFDSDDDEVVAKPVPRARKAKETVHDKVPETKMEEEPKDDEIKTQVGRSKRAVVERKVSTPKIEMSPAVVPKRKRERASRKDVFEKPGATRGRKSSASSSLASSSDSQSRTRIKYYIFFTGFEGTLKKEKDIVAKLGGHFKEDIPVVKHKGEEFILVVNGNFKRTLKVLDFIGFGSPIVSQEWLKACQKANCFVDAWDYILEDKAAEEKFGFNLRECLLKASKDHDVFKGWSIYFTPNVTPKGTCLKNCVDLLGGKFIVSKLKKWPDNLMIVSCEADQSLYKAMKKDTMKQKNVLTVTVQGFFECLQQQKLVCLDQFTLN